MKIGNIHKHPKLAFTTLCIGFMMTILDLTIVNVALVNIKDHLHAPANSLQWIVDGYALFYASFLLTAGALGDRIGNKRIFISGVILFTFFSLVCGLAPNITILLIGRILQGMSAAFLVPASLALVNHTFPNTKQRAIALSIYGAIGGFGASFGLILGGFLVDALSWRSIFIINLPIGIIVSILTLYFVNDSNSKNENAQGFDILGQIAAVITLSSLTFGIIEGKGLGWTSPYIISSFILFIVSFALFLLREVKTKEPMLPLSFFKQITFSAANIVGFFIFFTIYGEIFVTSLFFQQVLHYTPLQTGLAMLPQGLAIFIPSLFMGQIVGKVGEKLPIMLGLIIGSIAYISLALVTPETAKLFLSLTLICVGLVLSLCAPAIIAIIVSHVDKENSGIASSIFNVSRQTGAIVGVAVLGALVSEQATFVPNMHVAFSIAAIICIFSYFITWKFIHPINPKKT